MFTLTERLWQLVSPSLSEEKKDEFRNDLANCLCDVLVPSENVDNPKTQKKNTCDVKMSDEENEKSESKAEKESKSVRAERRSYLFDDPEFSGYSALSALDDLDFARVDFDDFLTGGSSAPAISALRRAGQNSQRERDISPSSNGVAFQCCTGLTRDLDQLLTNVLSSKVAIFAVKESLVLTRVASTIRQLSLLQQNPSLTTSSNASISSSSSISSMSKENLESFQAAVKDLHRIVVVYESYFAAFFETKTGSELTKALVVLSRSVLLHSQTSWRTLEVTDSLCAVLCCILKSLSALKIQTKRRSTNTIDTTTSSNSSSTAVMDMDITCAKPETGVAAAATAVSLNDVDLGML